MGDTVTTYICNICGWIYDPEQGDPDGGIAPGTPWEEIPDDWVCPVCGAGKEDFEPAEALAVAVAVAVAPTVIQGSEAGVRPVVIVGSGLAGYALAKELRKRDADLSIVMATAEGGEVYSKPMLSNALARHHAPEDMVQKEAAAMAAELGIEIRARARVLAIDRDACSLTIEDAGGSTTLDYDRLVLALGADPRVFPVEGSDAVDICTVNDLDDYRHWRERIGQQSRILLIGAGLIGCEFANDLAGAGFDVAMVDPAPWPLARLLPKDIGEMLAGALEEADCRLHLGRTVVRYEATGPGLVATLDDGTEVPFDQVLSAVGLAPRTALAKAAGLQVQAGIVVDRLMRTSDPAIYALGDCAETEAGPLPFIAPLLAEARALAATLSGDETPLQLPAMPVVVKTPALPLVVCPPRPGIDGAWELETSAGDAVAVFRTPDGAEVGFVLAGSNTNQQQSMAKRMPYLLSAAVVETTREAVGRGKADAGDAYECETCGYVYDPIEGDPDGGIAPGTRWEDIPEDWICPVCGAGKEVFTKV